MVEVNNGIKGQFYTKSDLFRLRGRTLQDSKGSLNEKHNAICNKIQFVKFSVYAMDK